MTKKIKITVKRAEKKKIPLKINTDFIKLDSALKLAGIAQTGGHAKAIISGGEIKINGEKCEVRGKKLRPGDLFEYGGSIYEIV